MSTSTRTLSKDGSIHVTDDFYATLISSCAALLSFIGAFFLLVPALHNPLHLLAFGIYSFSIIFLFTCSALHHGIDGSKETEHFWLQMDYYAIYISIAGTLTPFCLLILNDPLRKITVCATWLMAALGIFLKAKIPHLPKKVSTALYIIMGWLALALAKPIYEKIPYAMVFILLGGLIFMIGVVIYLTEKPNPVPGRFGFHEIWHLFVVAGSACNFFAIYSYLPTLP